jgi:uncharacterized protein
MSNIATVQAIYEAFGRGDVPSILEHLADDVAWESWADNSAQKAGVPWLLPRTGKAAVAEFFGIAATMGITEFTVLGLLEGGNEVAAPFVIAADVPGGQPYRDEEIHLWTFNDAGKVTRLRHYVDTAKHIASAPVGATT